MPGYNPFGPYVNSFGGNNPFEITDPFGWMKQILDLMQQQGPNINTGLPDAQQPGSVNLDVPTELQKGVTDNTPNLNKPPEGEIPDSDGGIKRAGPSKKTGISGGYNLDSGSLPATDGSWGEGSSVNLQNLQNSKPYNVGNNTTVNNATSGNLGDFGVPYGPGTDFDNNGMSFPEGSDFSNIGGPGGQRLPIDWNNPKWNRDHSVKKDDLASNATNGSDNPLGDFMNWLQTSGLDSFNVLPHATEPENEPSADNSMQYGNLDPSAIMAILHNLFGNQGGPLTESNSN